MTPQPEQPQPEQPQPKALARPAVYIDVFLQGGKQVYEIDVARELHQQLGMALASLDGPPPNRKQRRATKPKKKTTKKKTSRTAGRK